MNAWKEHRSRKEAARPDPKLKERYLTQKMLLCRPDENSADPTTEVENRDALYHTLIEASEPETRAQLHGLSLGQRQALISYLCESLNFDATSDQPLPNADLLLETAKSWLEEREDDGRHSRRQSR
jgi:hypothetical protein